MDLAAKGVGIANNSRILTFALLTGLAATSQAEHAATVPLEIDDGRPVVELVIIGPDATQAKGRFLVDTGGGAFIIPESVAQAAGIEWTDTMRAEGRELARPDALPAARFGTLDLALLEERVLIAIDYELGLLPGHLLAQHHVIFDYPQRTLTLAAPGSRTPVGQAFPMPISQPMGFPYTEIEVVGERVGMLLDTGPAVTILSQAVLQRWADAHPDWAHHEGAFGQAEALQRAGGQVLETLMAEDVEWAGFDVGPVTLAGQREGVFENYMSQMMTAPIVGALGSNVFHEFRMELDYLNETVYLQHASSVD